MIDGGSMRILGTAALRWIRAACEWGQQGNDSARVQNAVGSTPSAPAPASAFQHARAQVRGDSEVSVISVLSFTIF